MTDQPKAMGGRVKVATIRMTSLLTQGSIRLWRDESGQDLIEYALVAALVGLAAIASIKGLGTKIAAAFTNIGTTLTTNT